MYLHKNHSITLGIIFIPKLKSVFSVAYVYIDDTKQCIIKSNKTNPMTTTFRLRDQKNI